MTSLAAILIAISLADWLHNSSTTTFARTANLLLIGTLTVAAGLVNYFAYSSLLAGLLTVLTLSLGISAWIGFRNLAGIGANDSMSGDKGWLALTALGTMIGTGGLLIPALTTRDIVERSQLHRHLADYLQRLPWSQLSSADPELILLTVAMSLFLGSTSNAIVKTVMTLVKTGGHEASGEQLKGGRYIGPLERWLIFGLALASQPTAAALVISAKSIIRFPELQSKAKPQRERVEPQPQPGNTPLDSYPGKAQQIDELTEYFLIGSLLSWLLALAAALPIAAAG